MTKDERRDSSFTPAGVGDYLTLIRVHSTLAERCYLGRSDVAFEHIQKIAETASRCLEAHRNGVDI